MKPLPLKGILFLLAVISGIFSVVFLEYFPSLDGPVHVLNGWIVKQVAWDQEPFFRSLYQIYPFVPNASTSLLFSLLLSVFPVSMLERVALVIHWIIFPLSSLYLLRVVSANIWLGLFLLLPFANHTFLHLGFYNFSFGIPLYFFLLGVWFRYESVLRLKHTATLAGLLALLYFTHLFCFVIGATSVLYLSLGRFSLTKMPTLRQVKIALVVSLVPGVLAALFLKDLGFSFHTHAGFERLFKMAFFMGPLTTYQTLGEKIGGAVYLAVLLPLCIKTALAEGTPYSTRIGHLTLFALILYFILPQRFSEAGDFLNLRVLHLALPLMAFWISSKPRRVAWQIAAVVAGLLVHGLLLYRDFIIYTQTRPLLEEALGCGRHIEEKSTFATLLVLDPGKPFPWDADFSPTQEMALFHVGARMAVGRKLVELDNPQTNSKWFPLRFRPEIKPNPDYVLLLDLRSSASGWKTDERFYATIQACYRSVYLSKPHGIAQLYKWDGRCGGLNP